MSIETQIGLQMIITFVFFFFHFFGWQNQNKHPICNLVVLIFAFWILYLLLHCRRKIRHMTCIHIQSASKLCRHISIQNDYESVKECSKTLFLYIFTILFRGRCGIFFNAISFSIYLPVLLYEYQYSKSC